MSAKPDVWVVIPLKDAFIEELRRHFTIHHAPEGPTPEALELSLIHI